MSDDQNQVTVHDEPADGTPRNDIPDDELEDVAGGGPLYDAYLIVKDGWSDFKEGFSDAMND